LPPLFPFDNRFAREMDGFYLPVQPAGSPAPAWLHFNDELAELLGLDPAALHTAEGLAVFAGNAVPPGAQPVAQVYAGHQFGGFSPQLGDGRALLLGEVVDTQGQRRDVALKGSGRTPFSRGGDGLAAVGPVLREVLMGEAMHALGIPTTRALAAVATGQPVQREHVLPGAILTRVAASHLRVGTFEFFAARQDTAQLQRLADHAIERHDPQWAGAPDRALRLLDGVIERQAALVAAWMGVGFIHGVMNTDNMTISGETIDYGPCAFLEHYDPAAVFSSIDRHGRYAFGRQPGIAQWNLARLASALLPLIDADADRATELATAAVQGFAPRFEAHWRRVLHTKLGCVGTDAELHALADEYLALLQAHRVDFSLAFRGLADAALGNDAPLTALFGDAAGALAPWLQRWHRRCAAEPASPADRATALRCTNPIHIPRHHLVEAALSAAEEHNDLQPFNTLLQVLKQPNVGSEAHAAFAQPAPTEATACYKTFCGT
jgi:uncharacterized protein YdiU (UPF0061 family)